MDQNNPEIQRDLCVKPSPPTDLENSEFCCPEEEQRGCAPCTGTEDVTTPGTWSQRSISRSLQRAETLLRTTFNPSLKWLFQGRSLDEEEEEGNFVVAHNLVSRSSARLLRLQQVLLSVAPQWRPVGRVHVGSPQVCVRSLPAECGVHCLSSPLLHGHYTALWRLLEQRALLLFMHEFNRRARLNVAYITRVRQHLQEQQMKSKLTPNQMPFCPSELKLNVVLLCQELRMHLNHWSCLSSKIKSDYYLRSALVPQSRLLVEIRHTLDFLGLQALVLMDRYVHGTLSALAQTELDSVPRDVLEDILAATDLYNQAVEEQRLHHSATQMRTAVLQQACFSRSDFRGRPHPAAFSVKDLVRVLAVNHADRAARQLGRWAVERSIHACEHHRNGQASMCSDNSSTRVDRHSCGNLTSHWTWEQMQNIVLTSFPLSETNQSPANSSYQETPLDIAVSQQHHPASTKSTFVQHGVELQSKHLIRTHSPNRCQQTSEPQIGPLSTSVGSNLGRKINFENCQMEETHSTPTLSPTLHHLHPLTGFCQQDRSEVALFFQVLVSSSDLLSPLVSHTSSQEAQTNQMPADAQPPNGKTGQMLAHRADSVKLKTLGLELNRNTKDVEWEETEQEWIQLEPITHPAVCLSSSCERDELPENNDTVRAVPAEIECVRQPRSVQWMDLGQSVVFADLFGQYQSLLWIHCAKALWLQLHVPRAGNTAGSINLFDTHSRFKILNSMSQASGTDLLPQGCRDMLEDFSLYVLVRAAQAQWDIVLCRSIGSTLKDKCLNQAGSRGTQSSLEDSGMSISVTMEHFLQLLPPLLTALGCHQRDSRAGGSHLLHSKMSLQRQTVGSVLATVQLATVWIMSKAYQFLSSWSLSKFLLITQGDLKILRESITKTVQQTKCLALNAETDCHSLHNHNHLLLTHNLGALDRAVCELQNFSSLVLKTFSNDCKRMSGEIFEQTMPSAVHWRLNNRTGFPSCPNEYACLAAQTVIGQVLEGVAQMSDDARIQTLSVTMTAFMEAWMEHILKQKIKFSVQGALQLKQDFDSIRELIQSDKYGLSDELHQRLLSLRVFHQVDSAVLCLLQQPQVKPYLQSRTWEPFTHCCPTKSSRDSCNAAVGSSITNLGGVEGDDLTHPDPSVVTTDIPSVDLFSPREPYLAPSLALGASQQEWLDLRMHGSTRRWRLPGLQCLSKSEP